MFDRMIPALASQTAAWLLTYLLHSTLFLGLAWLLARGPARRRPALEETAWRFALVAALLTATVQTASGREPLAGRWGLPETAPEAAFTAAPAQAAPAVRLQPALAPSASLRRAVERAAASAVPAPAAPAGRLPFAAILTGLWAAAALALGARWLAAHAVLRRRLAARPEVVGGDMHRQLRQLAGEAGLDRPVRLTCSSRLPVPIALGVRRLEICVPPRALAALAAEEQQGLLAHEMGHLVRRDPFWLAFSHFLSSVLFFQPLNFVARRRLRELSELHADQWAVEQTGRPLSLARCLAEVAGWSFQPLGSLVAPGMADRPSHLAHRIRRLLDGSKGSPGSNTERAVRPVWLAAGMAALLIAVAAAAPVVSAAASSATSATASTPSPAAKAGSAPSAKAQAAAKHAAKPAHAPHAKAHAAAPDDLDIDVDIDPAVEQALDAVGGLDINPDLSGLDQLASLGDVRPLTPEEEKALNEKLDSMNRDIEERLRPQMEEMQRKLEKEMESLQNSPAMEKLRARADEIARQSRPSDAEIEKLRAEAMKLNADGHLTAEERDRIREQAHRLADQSRLTDAQRAEIQDLSRQAREESQRFMKEHKAQIDALRQEMQEQATAIREQVRRQIESDPQLRALRERSRQDRKEIEKRRQEHREHREKGKKTDGAAIRQGVEGGVRGGVQGGVQGGVGGGVEGGVHI